MVLSRRLEYGGGVYSCNFEGNKRSLLYSLFGSQAQSCSWVANAPQGIYSCMHMKVTEVAYISRWMDVNWYLLASKQVYQLV